MPSASFAYDPRREVLEHVAYMRVMRLIMSGMLLEGGATDGRAWFSSPSHGNVRHAIRVVKKAILRAPIDSPKLVKLYEARAESMRKRISKVSRRCMEIRFLLAPCSSGRGARKPRKHRQ